MVLDADQELPDLPPFSGAELVRLHALGFHDAVARLRGGATRAERLRERNRYLQIAGVLLGGEARHLASRLAARTRELLRSASLRALPIPDVGTVDGALAAALLVAGWQAPDRITVYRALTARRSTRVAGTEQREPAQPF